MLNLSSIPDVNFIEKDVDKLLADMISEYEEAYFQQTGHRKKLYPSDPVRVWIYTQALKQYQVYQMIDFSAKMNLLKYSMDGYLDNLGARYGDKGKRLRASNAVATVRFTLSAVRAAATSILKGTRVSPGNNIFFAVKDYAEIPAGSLYVDAKVECMQSGIIGNSYTPGQINILVDPIPFISNVSNIDTSQGGSDIEDNESYRERLYILPESFSVAGPTGAYEFFAKQYSSSISDIKITSPAPGTVDIRALLESGEVPGSTFLQGLQEYLSAKTRRPLTDYVRVQAPDIVNYDINLTYYIRSSEASSASSIQQAITSAVDGYILWQRSKIGRDINPSELTVRTIQAGSKRIEITLPAFVDIPDYALAVANNVNVIYGGLEDD